MLDINTIKTLAKSNYDQKLISKATYFKALLLTNIQDNIILNKKTDLYKDFKAICIELVSNGSLIQNSEDTYSYVDYDRTLAELYTSLVASDEKVVKNKIVSDRLGLAYQELNSLTPTQKNKKLIGLIASINNVFSMPNYALLASQTPNELLSLSSFNQIKANGLFVTKGSKAFDLIVPTIAVKEDGEKIKGFKIDKFFDISQTNLKDKPTLSVDSIFSALSEELKLDNTLENKEQVLKEELEKLIVSYCSPDDVSFKIVTHIFSKKIFDKEVLEDADYSLIDEEALLDSVSVYGSIAKRLKLKDILDSKYFIKSESVNLKTLRKEVLEHGKDAPILKNIPESEHTTFIKGVVDSNSEKNVHILKDGVYETTKESFSNYLLKKQLKNDSAKVIKTKKQLDKEQEEATTSLFDALSNSSDDKILVDASSLKSKFLFKENTKIHIVDENNEVLESHYVSAENYSLLADKPLKIKTNDDGVSESIITLSSSQAPQNLASFTKYFNDLISADDYYEQKDVSLKFIDSFLVENGLKMTIIEKNDLVDLSIDSFLNNINESLVIGKNHLNEEIGFNKKNRSRFIIRDSQTINEPNLPFKYDRYLRDISYLTKEEFTTYNKVFGLYNDDYTSKISSKKSELIEQISNEAFNLVSTDVVVKKITNDSSYENALEVQEALENRIKEIVFENKDIFSKEVDITAIDISSLAVVSYFENIDIQTNNDEILEKRKFFNLDSFNFDKEVSISEDEKLDFSKKDFIYPSSPILRKSQIKAIYSQIDKAPKNYETENQEIKKVFTKLFTSNMTYYIVEKDSFVYENKNTGHTQAFGYIENLSNPEFSEWGYINVDMVVRSGAEMDLYFKDKYINQDAKILDSKELLDNIDYLEFTSLEDAINSKNVPLLLNLYESSLTFENDEKELYSKINSFSKALNLDNNKVLERIIKNEKIDESKHPLDIRTDLVSFFKGASNEYVSVDIRNVYFTAVVEELIFLLEEQKKSFLNSDKYFSLLSTLQSELNHFNDFVAGVLLDEKTLIELATNYVKTKSSVEVPQSDDTPLKKDVLLGKNIFGADLFATGDRRFLYTTLGGADFANYEVKAIFDVLTTYDRYKNGNVEYLTEKEFLDLNENFKLYDNQGILIPLKLNLNNDFANVKFEINAKNNSLKVFNLTDFYSKDDIKTTFIDKMVAWEIFSNNYIFDLDLEEHISLLKDKLNIDVNNLENKNHIKDKPLVIEDLKDVTVFNKLKRLAVTYEEGYSTFDDDKEIHFFDSFEDIQKNFFLKKYPTIESLSSSGYDKIGIEIVLSNDDETDNLHLSPYGMKRVDVSKGEGDFNPYKESFADYIQKAYSNDEIYTSDEDDKYSINIDFSTAIAIDKKNSSELVAVVNEDILDVSNNVLDSLIDMQYQHFFRDGFVSSNGILKTKAMSRETFKEFETYLVANKIGKYLSKKEAKGKDFGFVIENEDIKNYFTQSNPIIEDELVETANNEVATPTVSVIPTDENEKLIFVQKQAIRKRVRDFLKNDYLVKHPELEDLYTPFIKMDENNLILSTVTKDLIEKNTIIGTFADFMENDNDKLLNTIAGTGTSYLEEDLNRAFELKKYQYGLKIRPVSIGAVPEGYKLLENSSSKEYPFGIIEYDIKLSDSAKKLFSLVDLSQEHFDNSINKVITKMGKYAPKYLTNESHFTAFVNDVIGGTYDNRIDMTRYSEFKEKVVAKIQNNIDNNVYNTELVVTKEESVQKDFEFIKDDVSKNYINFNFNDKLSNQDTLDALFNERIVDIINALSINEKGKVFCDNNVKFEKTETNIVGMSVFGVDDNLMDINGLIAKIQSTPMYKAYVEKQSTTQAVDNFVLDTTIEYGGLKTRFKNNMEALDIVKKVENQESISVDEKLKLSKYVGWGGLSQAFYRNDGSVPKGWEKEALQLKNAVSDEEYEELRKSVLNAHYTPVEVTKSIWRLIDRFGFEGGNILEPSVGIGNFVGTMPTKFISKTNITGVELDTKTSLVAQALYPNMNVINKGFQEVKNGEYSLIIGNPPFGATKIFDEEYNHLGLSIHNYFFAKSVDNLKENGLLAMVVSNAFLDSSSSEARDYISKKARLLGAIRLPNNMFVENANTEVTTDIILLQKTSNEDLLNYKEWNEISSLNETPINKYFVKNKTHLLGEWGTYGTMYQGGTPALVAKNKEEALSKLNYLVENFSNKFYGEDFLQTLSNEDRENVADIKILDLVDKTIDLNFSKAENLIDFTGINENSYFILDDKLYYREFENNYKEATTKFNSKDEEVELKPTEVERIKGMVLIASKANTLRKAQVDVNYSEDQVELIRAELNSVYDSFVKSFGYLSSQTNKNLIMDDANAPLLLSLEKNHEKAISKETAKKTGETPQSEKAEKSDIFVKRTQYPHIRPAKAENVRDAYFISLNENGYVDFDYVGELLDVSEDKAQELLINEDLIYFDDEDGYVTKDDLLQGNLKEKLKYLTNHKSISLVEENIPQDLNYLDINITFGANWIPNDIIADFVNDITGRDDSRAILLPHDSTWNIKAIGTAKAEQKFGSTDADFNRILSSAINSRTVTITKTDINKHTYVDKEATMIANQKVQEVKNYWADWVYQDEDRAKRLETIYNEKFNVFATNLYFGEHLTLIGASNEVQLRPHQKNGVQRALTTGKVLYDHTVGTGKTFTSIATVKEFKRTNRANKPMIVVPNHLTLEWGSQFLRLYPNANILVPSPKDFSKKRRKILLNRIATGDYDAIIIAHSQFGMIESDADFKKDLIKKEIDSVSMSIDLIRRENGSDGRTVKQIETQRANLEYKLKELDNLKRDEDILTFEEMGIDCLVVDEAHEFKNLQYSTSMQRIGGLGNPKGSKKAFDMFVKVQSLLKKTENKNLIFLTGTPISNSIAEMFTMQRYMQYDELDRVGATHFDAWAKLYADAITDWEITATQQYKLRTVLSKFKNIPELIAQYKQFADVITNDDVNKMLLERGEKIPTPKIKSGKPQNIVLERSEDQASFIGELDENDQAPEGSLLWRSEHLPKKAEKGADNMLVVINDAKKCSLDMRIIDEDYADNPNSKVNKMLEIAMETYEQWNEDKGVQIIFCDMSTPKGKDFDSEREHLENIIALAENDDEDAEKELAKYTPDEIDSILNANNFSVYEDVKLKLIEKGIPASEVAFIHDAKTDKQKEELFGKCRSGKVRFILGSTSKMGAGTNIQNRLVALHHLDVAWRPSDLEQREGRIIRQGNELYAKYGDDFEVGIYRYATKDTLDTVMWGTIERKAKFIEQIKKGVSGREIEDLGSESINASEMKALTSGNPLMLEQITLSNEIKKLEALEKEHKKSLMYFKSDLSTIKNRLERNEAIYPDLKIDASYSETLVQKVESINKIEELSSKDLEVLKEAKENRTLQKTEKTMKAQKVKERINSLLTLENGKKILDYHELGEIVMNKFVSLPVNKSAVLGKVFEFDFVLHRGISSYDLLLERETSHELGSSKNPEISGKAIIEKIGDTLCRLPHSIQSMEYSISKDKLRIKELQETSFENDFKDKDLLEHKREKLFEVIKELEMQREAKINKAKGAIHNETKSKEDEKINEIKSLKTEWADTNKNVSTKDLLKSVNIDVLDNLNHEFIGNCLVLNDTLNRDDYLQVEKICSKFGGDWNRKLQAIVFSDEGLNRIKEAFEIKKEYLANIVDTYGKDDAEIIESVSRTSHRQKIS